MRAVYRIEVSISGGPWRTLFIECRRLKALAGRVGVSIWGFELEGVDDERV